MNERSDSFKRKRGPWENDNDLSVKRRCLNNTGQNVSGTKNLANNRLKRLKDAIQADLKSRNGNNFPTSALPCRELSSNANDKNISLRSLTGQENSKILTQKDICTDKEVLPNREQNDLFSPIAPVGKKNIAEERLQKIKRMLNKSEQSKNLTEVSNTDHNEENFSNIERPHCSNVRSSTSIPVGGVKTNVNNVINSNNEACDEGSIRKKLATIQNTTLNKDVDNNIKNCSEKMKLKCGTIVKSDDLNDLKQNVNINPNFDINKLDHNTMSVSQRLSKIKKCDITDTTKNFDDMKSGVESQKVLSKNTDLPDNSNSLENIPNVLPLPRENNSSFSSKMAMTASWIMNHHQDGSSINHSLKNSGNSLSVNVDESTAKINLDETEDMEWTNAEPDDEIIDPNTGGVTKDLGKKTREKLKDLCIVVDTNVFISGLSKIRDLTNMKVTGPSKPLILIPWMVMTELDFMKHSSSDVKLHKNVTNSIAFINSMLEQKHPRIIGQTVHEVEKQKYIGKSPDDKIISCCLQVAEKYEKVILLSNDVNLKSKAMIHDIQACSTNEIMMKIMSKLSKNNKCKKVMHKVSILCSTIICECAKEAYGDVWTKMDMLSRPPWSLVECLKRFKKYWSSIFREKLLKQFTRTVEDLLDLLQSNKCICDDSKEFVKLMKLCITLCIFLKDIEDCRGFCENCINEITSLT